MQTDRLEKGDIGEMKVKAKLTELGYVVSSPESVAAYDLIVDIENSLHKVQVKTTHKEYKGDREVYAVNLTKSGRFYNGDSEDNQYSSHEVDFFAIYNDEVNEIYWLSFDEAPSWGTDRILDGWRDELIDQKI